MRKFLFIICILLSTTLVFAQDSDVPDVIIVEQPAIIPEGIEYDAVTDRFLLGSLAQGTIFSVEMDGTVMPLIEDEDLIATNGIHIDHTTNRLLVTNSTRQIFGGADDTEDFASLVVYDLETLERLFLVELTPLHEAEKHFANDVTSDAEGNAYVTDSLAGVVYKITPDGDASVFLAPEEFVHPLLGSNGIEFHPDGFLLVAVPGYLKVYKVPLDDPDSFSLVETDQNVGFDGLVLHPNGNLIGVSILGRVLALHSDDEWATATVIDDQEARAATTVALRGDQVYAIIAQLRNQDAEEYEILRVPFEAVTIAPLE